MSHLIAVEVDTEDARWFLQQGHSLIKSSNELDRICEAIELALETDDAEDE